MLETAGKGAGGGGFKIGITEAAGFYLTVAGDDAIIYFIPSSCLSAGGTTSKYFTFGLILLMLISLLLLFETMILSYFLGIETVI